MGRGIRVFLVRRYKRNMFGSKLSVLLNFHALLHGYTMSKMKDKKMKKIAEKVDLKLT